MQTTRLCVSVAVENRLHVLALAAAEAERGDRRGRVALQPVGIGRIAPGSCHDLGAVARPDLALVGLDDGVDRRRIDQPLLRQDGFQRAHPRRHRVELVVVMVTGQ